MAFPPAARASAPPWVSVWTFPLIAALLAAGLRFFHFRTAYELHIDEVTYARVADSVATSGQVDLYGEPFFLHPPLVFLTEGLLLRWAHLDGTQLDVVLLLRVVPILAATVTAALLVHLVRRVTQSATAGLAAGLVFAVDPFLLRQTSRNLLEAPALLAAVATVTLATYLIKDPRHRRPRVMLELGTGALAGTALLVKEPTAFLVLAPLAVAFAWGRTVPRRSSLRAAAVAVAVYLLYPLWALASGHGGLFAQEKLSGVMRLVGAQQTTGFNAGRGPGFVETLVDALPAFAPAYLLLALSGPAVLLLLLTGNALQRWVATWTASAQVLMVYLVLVGTLEEQFFSYLVAPAVAVTVTAWSAWLGRSRHRPRCRLVGAFTAAVFLAVASLSWGQSHLSRHDGYALALDALRSVAPCGAVVAATAEPLPFLLDGYRIVETGDLASASARDVAYAVTASKQVTDGFGVARPATIAYLRASWRRIYASPLTDGAGVVTVWQMPGAATGSCHPFG